MEWEPKLLELIVDKQVPDSKAQEKKTLSSKFKSLKKNEKNSSLNSRNKKTKLSTKIKRSKNLSSIFKSSNSTIKEARITTTQINRTGLMINK